MRDNIEFKSPKLPGADLDKLYTCIEMQECLSETLTFGFEEAVDEVVNMRVGVGSKRTQQIDDLIKRLNRIDKNSETVAKSYFKVSKGTPINITMDEMFLVIKVAVDESLKILQGGKGDIDEIRSIKNFIKGMNAFDIMDCMERV